MRAFQTSFIKLFLWNTEKLQYINTYNQDLAVLIGVTPMDWHVYASLREFFKEVTKPL